MEDTKTVKMGEKPVEEPKELSYKDLQNAAEQLFAQNKQMKAQIQAMQDTRFLTRLDFNLKIVELANKGGEYRFTPEFVNNTIAEIEESMTIKSEGNGEQDK